MDCQRRDWVIKNKDNHYLDADDTFSVDIRNAKIFRYTLLDMEKEVAANFDSRLHDVVELQEAFNEYDNRVGNWVIKIQLQEYLTESGDLSTDLAKAKIFKNVSRQSVIDKLENELNFGRCLRSVEAYDEAEQEYLARVSYTKLRHERYAYLVALAKEFPEKKIKAALNYPFVGLVTATTKEMLKAVGNAHADFVILEE